MLYSLALARGTYGQIQFGVTPAGSATRAIPPGTARAVAEEAVAPALAEPGETVQPAIPSVSSAPAPTAAAAAWRVHRLFPTITCAPRLCPAGRYLPAPGGSRAGANLACSVG